MLIIASGVILLLFILRLMMAPTLTIPSTLLAASMSSGLTFMVTNGAHVLARMLIALHVAMCTAFIFVFPWSGNRTTVPAPKSQTTGAQAQTNTCEFSYCVSPGSRVDLNTSNCTAHTKNLAESLRKKNKEHLTEDDKAALAALENGEGI